MHSWPKAASKFSKGLVYWACIQKHFSFLQSTNYKNSVLAATWSELGRVEIWNITQQLQAVDEPALLERYNLDVLKNPVIPLFSFNGHQQEGYGIDWCPTEPGVRMSKFIILSTRSPLLGLGFPQWALQNMARTQLSLFMLKKSYKLANKFFISSKADIWRRNGRAAPFIACMDAWP